jgi:hypothetical protein
MNKNTVDLPFTPEEVASGAARRETTIQISMPSEILAKVQAEADKEETCRLAQSSQTFSRSIWPRLKRVM